jgi:Ring finger domain/SWIM zinc finger
MSSREKKRSKSKKKQDDDGATTTSSSEKRAARAAPVAEKRPCRLRTSCPSNIADRLQRASTQRMYLIQQSIPNDPTGADESNNRNDQGNNNIVCEFSVLGSTGNVYSVKLQSVPCCNCPDFSRQQDLCKHIIFVLLKVVGLTPENPLSYQKAYLKSELEELLELLRSRRVGGGSAIADGSVMASAAVQTSFARMKETGSTSVVLNDNDGDDIGVKRRSLEEDDDCDCPICFDKMDLHDKRNELTFCRAACGTNFHVDCITRWLKNAATAKKTCPNCRQVWIGIENPKKQQKVEKDEGYVNLGALQGVSPNRDYSTYRSYSSNKRRRTGW